MPSDQAIWRRTHEMAMDKGCQADRAQACDKSQGPRAANHWDILAEVFHARPGEVEEMIQRRLEERSWDE